MLPNLPGSTVMQFQHLCQTEYTDAMAMASLTAGSAAGTLHAGRATSAGLTTFWQRMLVLLSLS